MGFFSDLKEDLSQAVNELMPEEELNSALAGTAAKKENAELQTSADGFVMGDMAAGTAGMANEPLAGESLETVDLSSMLDKLDGIEIPEELVEAPEMSDLSDVLPETFAELESPVIPDASIAVEPEVLADLDISALEEAMEAESPVIPETFVEPESPVTPETIAEPEIFNEPETAEEYKEEAQSAGQDIMEELNVQEVAAELGTENVENENSKGAEFKMDETRTASDETAVVTEGMSITGDIISEGSLELIGKVNGNIDVLGKLNITGAIQGNSKAAEIFAEGANITGEITSQGSVKIGQSSVIIGNISANSAVIAGAVKGDIDVHGPVILDTSAIVMGNIKSKSVQINNGAVIEGMCSQCYADVNPTSFFEDFKKKK